MMQQENFNDRVGGIKNDIRDLGSTDDFLTFCRFC